MLDLGRLYGLKMYGLASQCKYGVLMKYGATTMDYRSQDFVQIVRGAEPEGLDFVFNGMGEEYFERGLAMLRRGSALIHYGAPMSLSHFLFLVLKLVIYDPLPNGKAIKGSGTIVVTSR